MRADDAWPIVHRSFGQSGIFGYSFTADDRHLLMRCMACDREECFCLDEATEVMIVSAIQTFEAHHLQACADRVRVTRERLQQAVVFAPVARTADEARRMMMEADTGYWSSAPGDRAKLPKGEA